MTTDKKHIDDYIQKFEDDMSRICGKFGIDYQELLERNKKTSRYENTNIDIKHRLVMDAIVTSISDKFEGEPFYMFGEFVEKLDTYRDDAKAQVARTVQFHHLYSRNYPNLFTKEMYAKYGVKGDSDING